MVTGGLSFFELSGDLSGDVVVYDSMGMQTGTEFASAGKNFLAPVPSYGMFIDYAMAKWAILRMRASSLRLNVSNIEGRFLDSRLTVDFYFTKHVAIGVGVNNTTLEYMDNGTNPIRIDYRYGGLVTYLGLSF